jgi:hypothetical protein
MSESFPHGSNDIAQVKIFSLKFDANTDIGVKTIALQTVVPAS